MVESTNNHFVDGHDLHPPVLVIIILRQQKLLQARCHIKIACTSWKLPPYLNGSVSLTCGFSFCSTTSASLKEFEPLDIHWRVLNKISVMRVASKSIILLAPVYDRKSRRSKESKSEQSIKAEMKNSMLKVVVPKVKEEKRVDVFHVKVE
ncbi:hypothetical protein DVH24_004312 [Malus domestica]|uniref:SHSP domain-containing protein n=1 Tax=Malus domestica TaxID=3750 RepID=A0A498K5X3_MALDO|nr:hypothetical protein DVH24_004312 [Malus domestica]